MKGMGSLFLPIAWLYSKLRQAKVYKRGIAMEQAFVFQWHLLIYPLAAIAYFELLRRLDNHWARRTPLTDEEILSRFARSHEISEYDVFGLAAPNWSIDPDRIEQDFNTYLLKGILPHYVLDFIRRLRNKEVE